MISIVDYSVFNYKFSYSLDRTYSKNNINFNVAPLLGWKQAIGGHRNDKILIVLDGCPKNALDIYPSYKGTRMGSDDPRLKIPMNLILSYLTYLAGKFNKDLHIVCAPNQEADQVISSLCHIVSNNIPSNFQIIESFNSFSLKDDPFLSHKKFDCQEKPFDFSLLEHNAVILTTDSDMYQLLRFDCIFMDNKSSVASYVEKPQSPKTVGHLNYYAIIPYKALCGDVSDNVPPSTSASPSKLIPLLSKVDSEQKLNDCIQDIRIGNYYMYLPDFDRQLFENNLSVTRLGYYGNLKELEFSPLNEEEVLSKL